MFISRIYPINFTKLLTYEGYYNTSIYGFQDPTTDVLKTRPVIPLHMVALADWISYSQFGFLLIKDDIYLTWRESL